MEQTRGKMKRPGSLSCRMPAAAANEAGHIHEMMDREGPARFSLKEGALQ